MAVLDPEVAELEERIRQLKAKARPRDVRMYCVRCSTEWTAEFVGDVPSYTEDVTCPRCELPGIVVRDVAPASR